MINSIAQISIPLFLKSLEDLLRRPTYDFFGDQDLLWAEAQNQSLEYVKNIIPDYKEYVERNGSAMVFLPILKSQIFNTSRVAVKSMITSSGTSGRPTQIPLDELSLKFRIKIMKKTYEAMGFSDVFDQAFCFLVEPTTTSENSSTSSVSSMAASVVTHKTLQTYKNCRAIHFMSRATAKGMELNIEPFGSLEKLDSLKPILILGYPSLIFHFIQILRNRGLSSLPLPKDSAIMTGGGWKSFIGKVNMDQSKFRKMASQFFVIPEVQIRDMFGLSESPIIFVQCEKFNFHVPSFCRASAIDPINLKADLMKNSQEGLLKIEAPFTTSFPLNSILTTDKVSFHIGCSCGRKSSYFIPLGRARVATFETCAMKIGQAFSTELQPGLKR